MANPKLQAMKRKVENGEVPGVDPAPKDATEESPAPVASAVDAKKETLRRSMVGLIGMVGMVLCSRAVVPSLTPDETGAIADAAMECADVFGVDLGDARLWSVLGLVGTIGAVAVPRVDQYRRMKVARDVTDAKPEPQPEPERASEPPVEQPPASESYVGA